MSPGKGQQRSPELGSRRSRMELDSLPEVIKTQRGHTVLHAPAPGAFCPEQGSNSLFLWNLCFFSIFFMP